jgi:malate dehydrogenase (quinone)
VAFKNLGLIKYLVGELTKSKAKQFESLKDFYPEADPKDWKLIVAGQRAQVIKRLPDGSGTLQFGTEVVSSADGSIAGLLGASPGASTSVHIMLEVLEKSFANDFASWQKKLKRIIPSLGEDLNSNPKLAREILDSTAKTLKLQA